jgi:hypothetical protein
MDYGVFMAQTITRIYLFAVTLVMVFWVFHIGATATELDPFDALRTVDEPVEELEISLFDLTSTDTLEVEYRSSGCFHNHSYIMVVGYYRVQVYGGWDRQWLYDIELTEDDRQQMMKSIKRWRSKAAERRAKIAQLREQNVSEWDIYSSSQVDDLGFISTTHTSITLSWNLDGVSFRESFSPYSAGYFYRLIQQAKDAKRR